jgi:hypothetical protein
MCQGGGPAVRKWPAGSGGPWWTEGQVSLERLLG